MNQFKFKYEFREYQKRALDEVHKYMQDDKIHIVAAPGAGKTILALQLMVEIGKNTLILVPTIALREQWIKRFSEDFTAEMEGVEIKADILSDDLQVPKPVTVITYQAIYSAYKENMAELIRVLKKQKVSVVILDEAHHLKTSWWKALDDILKKLKTVKLISLTATPPYDVYQNEWKRYLELCGEIDTEIMSPELVKKGNLCPHQDYIYFNFPTEKQIEEIDGYHIKRNEVFQELCNSNEFVTAISLNPGIICLEERVDYFLGNFEYYIALRSFLKYKGISVQESIVKKETLIPEFTIELMEILLTNCIFSDRNSYKDFSDFFKQVRRKLNEIGAIQEGKVYLKENKTTKKLITQNIGKLNSIHKIVQKEYTNMHERLKMVIITDYIREDVYETEEEAEVNVMGAIPIFKSIRKMVTKEINIAVLTGSIVIIPTVMKEEVLTLCKERNIAEVEITELAYDFAYARVWVTEKVRKHIVAIITELFETYDIQVLIGTGALIGEGWDAPFVNSLIMATFISSFVTSNQIRGRAIRTCKKDKNKTANIWHLVCLEKSVTGGYHLGIDYKIVKKRFETFEGIYLNENKIGRGIHRLAIEEKNVKSESEIAYLNNKMEKAASEREKIHRQWEVALQKYVPVRMEKVSEEEYNIAIRQTKAAGIKSNVVQGMTIAALYGILFMLFGQQILLVDIGFAGILVWIGSKIWQKRKDVYSIRKIAKAVLLTLVDMKAVEKKSKIVVRQEKPEIIFYMSEGSTIEKSRYNSCLREMLEPIEVPRYVLNIKKGYYQVPSVIGKNKKWVQMLEKHLKKEFGRIKILYTRTPSGKRELLEIKIQTLVQSKKK